MNSLGVSNAESSSGPAVASERARWGLLAGASLMPAALGALGALLVGDAPEPDA